MDIAVLMAVYAGDNPTSLGLAFRSIAQQRIHPQRRIKIYLVADGSLTEALEEQIFKFRNHLYRVLRLPNNAGLCNALNAIIQEIEPSDRYIFRMDADDICFPNRFELQINAMEARPEIDILGGSIVEFDSVELRQVSFPLTHEGCVWAISWRSPFAHPTVCFRADAIRKLGSYPESALNEDIAMWFKALKLGLRFANLSEPLVFYRVSEGFWSRRSFKKALGELWIYLGGVYKLHGLSFRLAFPIARFLFRLMPAPIRRWGYRKRSKMVDEKMAQWENKIRQLTDQSTRFNKE